MECLTITLLPKFKNSVLEHTLKQTGFRGILMRTYTNPRVDMGDSVQIHSRFIPCDFILWWWIIINCFGSSKVHSRCQVIVFSINIHFSIHWLPRWLLWIKILSFQWAVVPAGNQILAFIRAPFGRRPNMLQYPSGQIFSCIKKLLHINW